MQATLAPRGDARTFLTHFVGSGLDDDRYVITKCGVLQSHPTQGRDSNQRQTVSLHLLGIDHKRLTYYHNGIERRLTDVHGRAVTELLA